MFEAYDENTGEFYQTTERFALNDYLFADSPAGTCEHCGSPRRVRSTGLDDRASHTTTPIDVLICPKCDKAE